MSSHPSRPTAPNLIVLTSGLSGSSVLTGAIVSAGYWAGNLTYKKPDYDTFENEELIGLNLRLFKEISFQYAYHTHFSHTALTAIEALRRKIDLDPFRAFVSRCDEHAPWVWKDPRLWMTIRFWNNVVDLERCRFVLLRRGFFQAWLSATSRRLIQSYTHLKTYESKVWESMLSFVEENAFQYVTLSYEDLIEYPDKSMTAMNRLVGADVFSADNLKSIYHKPIYRRPGTPLTGIAKALMIYAKNYRERADLFAPAVLE